MLVWCLVWLQSLRNVSTYLKMYLFNANVKIIFPLLLESLPFTTLYSILFYICSGEKVK